MAVDEFESAVGQFIRQQRACEADAAIEIGERLALGVVVEARVEFVRHEIAGAHADVTSDAIADHGNTKERSEPEAVAKMEQCWRRGIILFTHWEDTEHDTTGHYAPADHAAVRA